MVKAMGKIRERNNCYAGFHAKRAQAFAEVNLKMFQAGLVKRRLVKMGALCEAVARVLERQPPKSKQARWAMILDFALSRGILTEMPKRIAVRSTPLPREIMPPAVYRASKAEFDAFYRTPQWRRLRMEAFLKYGRRCACCRAKNKPFHVDHIRPRSRYPHLELDLNNLQILCEDCNLGKGGWNAVDFRDVPAPATQGK